VALNLGYRSSLFAQIPNRSENGSLELKCDENMEYNLRVISIVEGKNIKYVLKKYIDENHH